MHLLLEKEIYRHRYKTGIHISVILYTYSCVHIPEMCLEICQKYILSNFTHKHTPFCINICILFCTCVYGRRENLYKVGVPL